MEGCASQLGLIQRIRINFHFIILGIWSIAATSALFSVLSPLGLSVKTTTTGICAESELYLLARIGSDFRTSHPFLLFYTPGIL